MQNHFTAHILLCTYLDGAEMLQKHHQGPSNLRDVELAYKPLSTKEDRRNRNLQDLELAYKPLSAPERQKKKKANNVCYLSFVKIHG